LVVLGQDPPEIASWERREWWLAGDATGNALMRAASYLIVRA
jgi:hypothetical protein